MSEQCMHSGTDTKYYDNVVLSGMMDVKQHDLAAQRSTSTASANSVKSSHALQKAPWRRTHYQIDIKSNGV